MSACVAESNIGEDRNRKVIPPRLTTQREREVRERFLRVLRAYALMVLKRKEQPSLAFPPALDLDQALSCLRHRPAVAR